ncbi:MAG TPA: hypothetical protein VLD37_04085 [Candidatus Bilamarchaeum sp.]|nr:hypothetical protein [Candidatus Bilamarchaeum sp.]
MPPVTKTSIAKAAAVGLSLGLLSTYLLTECPANEPGRARQEERQQRRGRRHEAQLPAPPTTEYFAEKVIGTIPYGREHKIGGFRISYENSGSDVIARIKYSAQTSLAESGLRLKLHEPATLPVPSKKLDVNITLDEATPERVTVTVDITPSK